MSTAPVCRICGHRNEASPNAGACPKCKSIYDPALAARFDRTMSFAAELLEKARGIQSLGAASAQDKVFYRSRAKRTEVRPMQTPTSNSAKTSALDRPITARTAAKASAIGVGALFLLIGKMMGSVGKDAERSYNKRARRKKGWD